MGIQSIAVRSAQSKYVVFDALFPDAPAEMITRTSDLTLQVDCDGGAISAFWYGPGVNGRVGDRWRRPYDFALPDLQPGDQKLVVEQYKLGKLIDRRVIQITIPAPRLRPRMGFGLVDLMKHDYQTMQPLIEPLGVTGSREWIGTGGFAKYKPRSFSRHATYAAAGITPTFCFAQSGLTPAIVALGNVAQWTTDAIKNILAQLGDAPFRIELGNEINLIDATGHGPYWNDPGSDRAARVRNYVDQVQRPMYQAIKSIDPKIECIAPGFSWDCVALESGADLMLECADMLAFHPYPNGVTKTAMERIARSVETAHRRSKRISFTEAQINYGKLYRDGRVTLSQWGRDLESFMLECARKGVDEFFYFIAFDAGTTNSPGAIFRKTDDQISPTDLYLPLHRALASVNAMP